MALQITVVEIFYHAVIPAAIVTSTVKNKWIFGRLPCAFIGVLHDGFAMFRFTMTFVLTVDRFISVFSPFLYNTRGKPIALILSAMAWFLTLIRVLVPFSGIMNCFTYIPTFKTCTLFPGCLKGCKYITVWSVGVIILFGVVLPLLLYMAIYLKVQRINKFFTESSVQVGNRRPSVVAKISKVYYKVKRNKKKFVSNLFLLTSIVATTPAFTLYIASLFYTEPEKVLFILNMLVGRTFFNFIPVFDALALAHQEDIKEVSKKVFHQLVKAKNQVVPNEELISVSHSQPQTTSSDK